MRVYRYALRLLRDYLADPPVSRINETDITRFAAWLRSEYQPTRMNGSTKPLSLSSLNNIWAALRSFYRWAAETLGTGRPDLAWKQPPRSSKPISPFRQEEIEVLLTAAEWTRPAKLGKRAAFRMRRPWGLRDRAILLVLLDTGIRAGELSRLTREDANLETGEVRVAAFGSAQKSKGRHVYIGKAARAALWRYLATREGLTPDAPLFITARGAPFNRYALHTLLARLGDRAGVADCHPHRFRHTFAIQYLRNGGDIFTLQRLLGHTELDMVRRYLALAQTDMAEAHQRASPVDRWRL